MKPRFLFFILLLICSWASQLQAVSVRNLMPRPKFSYDRSEFVYRVSMGIPLIVSDGASDEIIAAARALISKISIQYGPVLTLTKASEYTGGKAFYVGLINSSKSLDSLIDQRMVESDLWFSTQKEVYLFDADSTIAILAANDVAGLYDGISTVLQLITSSNGTEYSIQGCHVLDYPDYPQRWVFSQHNLLTNASLTALHGILDTMSAYKLNGLQQNDFKYSILQTQGQTYFDHVDTLKTYLKDRNIDIIPGVAGIGWSEGILYSDPNLAEGLHAISTYIIEADTGRLIPDSRVTIPNGNFESFTPQKKFTGYSFYDGDADTTWVDRNLFHSGGTSARCSHFHKNNAAGNARFNVKVNCDTDAYYVMSVWIRTQQLVGGELRLLALGADDGKSLTFTSLSLPATSNNWVRAEVTFNTLHNTSVYLYCGVWGADTGIVSFDDFSIRPGGLCNVLRRKGTPLTVTNKLTKQSYLEGTDFAPVVDPILEASHGTYFPYHTPPTFRRLSGGSLKNGDTISISYYHPFAAVSDPSGNGSVMVCVSEDTLYSILKDQVSRVNTLYNPKRMFMGHDEIRNMNHDAICKNRSVSPGVLLADNVTKCKEVIKSIAPSSSVLVWSDMFDSLHNATNNYYLIDGDLSGDWNLIPKDMTIVNWNGGKAKQSLQFFEDLGYKQITSPYYDAGNASTIRSWRLAQEEIAGIEGMMYTTWGSDYRFLRQFAYYSWGAGPAIIHTPFDSTVFQTPVFTINADVYADPFDAADTIRSVEVSIFDAVNGTELIKGPLIKEIPSWPTYSISLPNTLHTNGFSYSIAATNSQGITRVTPRIRVQGVKTQKLNIIPPALDFGFNVLPSVDRIEKIMLSNNFVDGDTTVIESIRIQPDSIFNFSIIIQTLPITIRDSMSIMILVEYKQTKESDDTATLDIVTRSKAGDSIYHIPIVGSAFPPLRSVPLLAERDSVILFPNPCTRSFALLLPAEELPAKASITDILGHSITIPITGRITQVPLEEWGIPVGEYLVRVITTHGQVVRKLLYNK